MVDRTCNLLREKTNIILLPEMFNTAFCPDEVSLAEEMQGKTINWMKKIGLPHLQQ